jgi:predicted DNA-binding transcriptional regulator AlpA
MRQEIRSGPTALVDDNTVPRSPEKMSLSNSAFVAAGQPGEALAFSIAEFCRRHGISRAHFYNLSKNGKAPALMRVGRRALISVEAAAEWRIRMETVTRNASTR